MDLNLNILRLASGLAAHASSRQQVVAENIAHADTPGYRARDVAEFSESLRGGTPAFAAKVTRPGHLAFGAGAHQCLGLHLARLEMRILFEELLPRLESVELDGEPAMSEAVFVNGPKRLPIRFTMN